MDIYTDKMPMTIKNPSSSKHLLTMLVLALGLLSTQSQVFAYDEKNQESGAFVKLKEFRDKTSDLTVNAMEMLGIKYKRGGNSPENGLDCSGFVRLVFKNTSDTELPRTAKEISNHGTVVDTQNLKPGDLVFYNTLKKSFSHVGIYLGDNKFIHSPSAGGRVRVESMNIDYWKKRFNGARRIEDGAEPTKK
jgi:cell wall-associated NlpC family hydrolase